MQGPAQTTDSIKSTNEIKKDSTKNNKRSSFDNETFNATKNQNVDEIVASNQSKINNIDWENIWGGGITNNAKSPEIVRNKSPITNQPPVTHHSNNTVNKPPAAFSFDFIDSNTKPVQSSSEINNNVFSQMNNIGNNQNSNYNVSKVSSNINVNHNVFQQFDNVVQSNQPTNNQMSFSNNNTSSNNNNGFNLYKKEDPLDRLLLESNFSNNQNVMVYLS